MRRVALCFVCPKAFLSPCLVGREKKGLGKQKGSAEAQGRWKSPEQDLDTTASGVRQPFA
jgi:hypothetical protein